MAVNTCDPALHSWVKSAEAAGTDFPIQNLPFGVARVPGEAAPRVMTAIGDRALNVHALAEAGVLAGLDDAVIAACRQTTLNALMALTRATLRTLRERLSALLEEARVETMRHRAVLESALKHQSAVEMLVPAAIGDYTDFYASIFHATNVGSCSARQSAAAELQVRADRLSRPRVVDRRRAGRRSAAVGTDEAARRCAAGVRAEQRAGLRTRGRRVRRRRESRSASRCRSTQRRASISSGSAC